MSERLKHKTSTVEGGFKSYLSKSIYKLEVSKSNSSQRMFIINFSIVIYERIYKSFDAGVNNKIIPIKTQFRPKCICLRPQGSEGKLFTLERMINAINIYRKYIFQTAPWVRSERIYSRVEKIAWISLLSSPPRTSPDMRHKTCKLHLRVEAGRRKENFLLGVSRRKKSFELGFRRWTRGERSGNFPLASPSWKKKKKNAFPRENSSTERPKSKSS